MDYCAWQILLIQLKFFLQKFAIKEKIMDIKGAYTGQRIMYYPKFDSELNYIEYFYYNGKS